MKNTLILFLFICFINLTPVYAQETSQQLHSQDINKNLVKPQYPGEPDAFQQYLAQTLRGIRIKGGINTKISFVVEKDGSVSNITFLTEVEQSVKTRIIKAFRNCEKWIPGSLEGKLVRVSHTLPIIIK
jgi:hypothetical protein